MHKIVHIISDMNFGGVGRYLTLLDEHLKNESEAFYLIMPKGSILKDHIKHMEIIEVDGLADKSFTIKGVQSIKKVLKEMKPDIIHTHGALSGRIVGRQLKIPTVFTKHTLSGESHGLKGQLKKSLNKYLNSKAIAVSKGAFENLKHDGFKDENISLIYNGVGHIELIDYEKTVKNRLVMVGRLESIKGPFECLKIIKILKEKLDEPFELIFAGDGSLIEALKDKVIKEALPVRFLGHVLDIHPIYETAHLVINTSASEALPYSIIEGMSHQKPVVAFDIPGITEVVENEKTGYIVPYLKHDIFADKIKKLLKDNDLCQVMGSKSQERVDELFSITQMISKLMKVYEGMYENHK